LWRWFRYENKAIYFLTKKGQRFLIEDREDAKFYLRTLTLTITMVGGAKLFMDKISIMLRRYRNN
jgi:predicted transcriptional regulator